MYYDALNKELIPKGAFKVPNKNSITILTRCGGDAHAVLVRSGRTRLINILYCSYTLQCMYKGGYSTKRTSAHIMERNV